MEIAAYVISIFSLMLISGAIGAAISYKIFGSKQPPKVEINVPPIEIKQTPVAAPQKETPKKDYSKAIEEYFEKIEKMREDDQNSQNPTNDFNHIYGEAQKLYDDFLEGKVDLGGENKDG